MSELHNVFNIRNLATVTGQCFRSYGRRTLGEGGLKEKKKKSSELTFTYRVFPISLQEWKQHPLPEGWVPTVWNSH